MTGTITAEMWIARLASVEAEPLLELGAVVTTDPLPGRVDAETSARLDAIAGGDPIGLQLLTIAAVRLVLQSWTGRSRHAIVMPLAVGGATVEVALATALDESAPVGSFLADLHRDLESAVGGAWADRSDVESRLAAAGSPAARALSQIAVVGPADTVSPSSVKVRLVREAAGLSIVVDSPRGRAPVAATALAPCVAAALTAIVEDPSQLCGAVETLGAAQRAQLTQWSGLPAPQEFPDVTLMDLVGASAQSFADRPALATVDDSWTHRELWEKAGSAAALLAGAHGVRPGDRVALLLPRGPALVLAILAIGRAGASYVPLDPAHPPARYLRQLRLSGARIVVTATGAAMEGVTAVPAAELVDAPPAGPRQSGARGDDEAVLFFTSGSTGAPRPVALSHRQLAHKAKTSAELIGFDQETRCAALSAISSDALTYQIFTTLGVGGCVIPLEDVDRLEPRDFWQTFQDLRINVLNCVPSLLAAMAEGITERQPLRHLLLGGDEIPAGLLPRLAGRLAVGTFANLYGPTEATVEAVSFVCPGDRLDRLSVTPIGLPSPGFAVIVRTERGDLAPLGVAGEMCILGPGVAECYLDEEPAGPGRFVELPGFAGARAFRTGDYARRRLDGLLDFLGRADGQLQINGNRVEPAEVEAVLSGLSGVDTGTVVSQTGRDAPARLIGVYRSALTPDRVRAELAARLPSHMVPGLLLQVDAIPLTAHGKVDRPAVLALAAEADSVQWWPDDPPAQALAQVWSDVLGRPPRSADEDFIVAGGHSLTAMMLTNRLCQVFGPEAITVRQVFAARTPAALLTELGRDRVEAQAVGARPADGLLPVSNAQRRLWFLEQYDDGELRAHNMVECFRLPGPVDPAALHRALQAVVARHEALRTVFTLVDGELRQRVLDRVDITLDVLRDQSPHQVRDVAQRRRMDLENGPLLQASWIVEQTGGVLVLGVHHAVFDGWSFAVVLRDLLALLRNEDLAEPRQYADVDRTVREDSRAYWHDLLRDLVDAEIPGDRHRTAELSSAGGSVRLPFGAETTRAFHAVCRSVGATPFEGFVAVVRVLLHRLYGHTDIALGSITAGRDDPRLGDAVGLFAHTVVLRTQVQPQAGFRDLVASVAAGLASCRTHEDYPFDLLVDELGVVREAGRNPIFDVLVESVFSGLQPLQAPGAGDEVRHLAFDAEISDFDLVFGLGEDEVQLSYRSDLFDRSTIERMAAQLGMVLRELVSAPDAPVGTVPFLPADQRDFLLHTANDTAAPFPAGSTLLDLVTEQVRRAPGAPAVIFGDRVTTFAELDAQAERLAARVAAAVPTGPDIPIVVACDRTDWMVTAMLAVLKTGSAFMPLDPEQPQQRFDETVRRAKATAILSDLFSAGVVPVIGPGTGTVAGREWPGNTPDDLAYIVHTSGSTGTPKGILIENRGIVNTVHYRARYYGFDQDSVVLQVPPIHFDSGINDVFSALIAGTPVVVISREGLLDPAEVANAIERNGVTHVMLVPSLYQLLLDRAATALRSVRQIVLVGERLPEALARRHAELLPQTVLYNEYGPAEDSVWTTVFKIADPSADVLIGHPISNKTVDLLGAQDDLVPIGLPGEICIGGVGVARGYLDPELTRGRFVDNPVRPGTRMYRTGDLAKRLPDGNLLYLGRVDNQVKIRGQRVEPDEVAAVLAQAPGVRNAAVIVSDDKLIAYVVGDAGPATMRAFLGDRLPAVMLPAAFVPMAELPVTVNGKLDRRALPAPSAGVAGAEEMTPDQVAVARLWETLLGQPVTSPDANLFELGGHSLIAARMAHELHVPIRTVMHNQTVRMLAEALASTPQIAQAIEKSGEQSVFPLSRAQRRIWLAARREHADAYLISDLIRLRRRVDPDRLARALSYVVARHQQLRVRIEGSTEPRQVAVELAELPLRVIDLPGADPDGPEVAAALREARARPFPPDQAPLFEIRLIRGSIGGDLLTVTAHHLIYDLASLRILLDDLFAETEKPPMQTHYSDWVAAETAWLASDEARRSTAFWRERLDGVLEQPDLVDAGRRTRQRGPARVVRREMPWREVAGRATTPYALVLTAFAAMVHRHTGVRDLVLGSPVGLRDQAEAVGVIGCYVNSVPIRLQWTEQTTLGELAAHAVERIVEAVDHSRLPFDEVVQQLGLRGRPGRSILLDLGVTWESASVGEDTFELTDILADDARASSDLWLYAARYGDRLRLELVADTQLVLPHENEALADSLVELLSTLLDKPDSPVGQPHQPFWSETRYDF